MMIPCLDWEHINVLIGAHQEFQQKINQIQTHKHLHLSFNMTLPKMRIILTNVSCVSLMTM